MPPMLTLVHRLRSGTKDLLRDQPLAVIFRTCLREIAFLRSMDLDTRSLAPEDQIFSGSEAYRFLLEIVCGLHSPLAGETEVLEQFKQFRLASRAGHAGWSDFDHLCDRLLADARVVRRMHLRGIGGRSYGRLVRRHVRSCSSVCVLGAGRLAGEVVAHLTRVERVEVFCRSREWALSGAPRHARVTIHGLAEVTPTGPRSALVIAAPMTARAVARWLDGGRRRFQKILDLRGECERDPLPPALPNVLTLGAFFAELEALRAIERVGVAEARAHIARLARAYVVQEKFRPFGWEDLCA